MAQTTKVKRDHMGLYVTASGYRSRPLCPSMYKEGDDVATSHFGGTPYQGVGKNESVGRGQYVETWLHDGYDRWRDDPKEPGKQAEAWAWYCEQYGSTVRALSQRSAAVTWFYVHGAPPWATYMVVTQEFDPHFGGLREIIGYARTHDEAVLLQEKQLDARLSPSDTFLSAIFKRPT